MPGIETTRPNQRIEREELIRDSIREKHQGQQSTNGCTQRPDIWLHPTDMLTRQKALAKGAMVWTPPSP
jgi:hypothetical protein